MIEAIALVLWFALCYIAGYLFGMVIAEWINRSSFRKEIFTHV